MDTKQTELKEIEMKRRELAIKLREKREAKDISQEELGKSLKISRIEMGRIEAGQVKNIDTYMRVAKALGLELQFQNRTYSKYE